MHIGILGAAEVLLDDTAVDLGTRKQRALLAALVLHRGRPVTPDVLCDLLWGDEPPSAVSASLQGYVARLRRALEPDRPARAPSTVLVTQHAGYALVLPEDAVDADRFERAVTAAHHRMGQAAAEGQTAAGGLTREELEGVLDDLAGALRLWRGLPYTELEGSTTALAERARLEDLRATALEARAVAALALGRHAVVAAELEVLTANYPLRERLWGLRAVALTRSGRQADALEVLRQVRELLAEELGLEPGVELRELQAAVLRQDPALQWAPPPGGGGGAPPPPGAVVLDEPPARTGRTPEPPWPLVGRGDQLAALVGTLEQSLDRPAFAVVTGEPGIGKSRLCAELAAVARSEGVTVVVGRCSQDDGAPPLHPWAKVLGALGHDLPSDPLGLGGSDDGGSRFRAWEQIAQTVLETARERHVLVILDDLHWADTSSLRVLRLLAESADVGRLMVVATWRHQPPPSGALAEVAETLARCHALRLPLTGLDADEAADIVSSLASTTPTAGEADALRARTDGNPFFLVEYARLARERGDLDALLREEHPPAAVQDVLTRRLAVLPPPTADVLRSAAVLGRRFEVATLSRLLGREEDEVLDDLEPALVAGLVREDEVDRMSFSHALVRDTVYAVMSRSRRARMHARAAVALQGLPGHRSEVARHWLSAGPGHAGDAWRAARAAAEHARHLFAYDEAVELLQAAVATIEEDGSATVGDRYALQMDLVRAYHLNGNWVALRPAVHGAIALAGSLDETVAAATQSMTNALWHATWPGAFDEVLVTALRDALNRLPPGDGAQRCKVMLSLAGEIYYSTAPDEREALAHEAIAMARRLGDPALLVWALLSGFTALWRSSTAELRLRMAQEAVRLARELGDDITLSTALTMNAIAAAECGQVDQMLDQVEAARRQAERHRHLYAQFVLDALVIPWLAMRGQFDEVDALVADMVALGERTTLVPFQDALNGVLAMRLMWRREFEALLEVTREVESSALPVTTVVAALLCRVGRLDEAREYLESHEAGLAAELRIDTWFSGMMWALGAEAAAFLRRPDLGAATYARLVELRGRPACAGSGTALGPADAFLALAAFATGERDLAARHAAEAERLIDEWRIPLAARWFTDVRQTLGL